MSQPSPKSGIAASGSLNPQQDSFDPSNKPACKSRRWSGMRSLIALNVVLLALLGTIILAPQTLAHFGSRSTYALISSNINGLQNDVVYVLDTASSEMIAISYNPQTNNIERLGYRRLSSDGARIR